MVNVSRNIGRKRISNGGNTVAKSSNLLGTQVWVRTDLVEAIIENGGTLPSSWKPRKRTRSSPNYFTNQQHNNNNQNDENTWGWCRAHVSSAVTPTTSPDKQPTQAVGIKTSGNDINTTEQININPFSAVKLRKINRPNITPNKITETEQESWRGSPDRVQKILAITITVDDVELAPPYLQNVTVSFNYETSDTTKVCMANVWWQPDQDLDASTNKGSTQLCLPPDDLTSLEQLHEPAVVYCLRRRYDQDQIYTYTGKVLLALNPFRSIDHIYNEETMRLYWNGGTIFKNIDLNDSQNSDIASDFCRPPPHIFAIAEDAYKSIIRSLEQPIQSSCNGKTPICNDGENQSILVSGESGAGKTVTTKIILRYLATLSAERQQHRNHVDSKVSKIESQVLESNPILESFGNARTVRNDNSSRFGKFMEMQFESSGCLISASIETYLLEKVRLISQSPGERNYHIFYEVLAGLTRSDRKRYFMTNEIASDFRMTALSGTFNRRDGVDDLVTFRELRHALNTVGFTKSEQDDLFHVVCTLLHISNLTFTELKEDGSVIDQKNPSLQASASLLGVDVSALNDAFTRCAIAIKDEVVYKNLAVDRAVKAVEAFIKTTYGALFTFIVRKINSFVTMGSSHDYTTNITPATIDSSGISHRLHTKQHTASIGVLDIFGFESFDRNSFEQLCINYCNEALQQQFNRFVFKLEQQEYEREGIEWSFIEFPDNQDVLDLIEKKHDGILSILDEQSRLPRCTDATFAVAVYTKHVNHARFEASKTQQARLSFSIMHYAGLVEYDTEFFLEKNKDELPKETTELLLSSTHSFLAALGSELIDNSVSSTKMESQMQQRYQNNHQLKRATSSILRDSVGIQFCSQLRSLRSRIESTAPHYVRCLKPNDDLIPYNFNNLVIAEQLRCAGVLEAIRVSRIGFPHRYYHDHFIHRYLILGRVKLKRLHAINISKLCAKDACEALIHVLAPDVMDVLHEDSKQVSKRKSTIFTGIQQGKSKVFLRRRAFEALEYLRSKLLEDSAIVIQAFCRMCYYRRHYRIKYNAILLIQNFVREVDAYVKRRDEKLRESIRIIQSWMRCLYWRRRLAAARWIAIWCQCAHRGAMARQYCAYLFLDQHASAIQRAWRSFCLTFTFRKLRSCTITLQSKCRSLIAFRELCRLRREAKDLKSVAADRDRFRQESLRLREELIIAKQLSPVKSKHTDRENEIQKLRYEVQRLHFELEKAHRMHSPSQKNDLNAKRLIEELADREDQLDRLKRELDGLRSRDESSMTVATSCASEFSYRLPRSRPSPVQSDTSLLDNEEDDYEITVTKCSSSNEQDVKHFPIGGDELKYLHSAIRHGDYRLLEEVLSQTSEACVLINQGDKDGRTAIHIASLSLNAKVAESLIARGAVVNAQDDDGETALHLAETAAMTELLLTKGRSNPNIPNVDGICALHLAVQRRDIESVRLLVRKLGNVNNADNVRWFTSLHLIALPARMNVDGKIDDDSRLKIAHVLSSKRGQNVPDFNYQDSEGNTPLHYAVQLESQDCCDLVSLFLESGANPNVRNARDQIPLHLLCHNTELKKLNNYQEIIHVMLMHGANPNIQSLTGCTPLHLSLYHRDIDTAVQLVHGGAELHLVWKKPKRWPCFWKDMGSSRVIALDMIDESNDLYRILSAITTQHKLPPNRSWCMHCKKIFSNNTRCIHCKHCSRLTCEECIHSCLPPEYFPKNFKLTESSWACIVCERILTSQKEVLSNVTHPVSSYGEYDDEDRFSC